MASGGFGASGQNTALGSRVSLGITLAGTKYPGGTVTFSGTFTNIHNSKDGTINLYLCDSAGGNAALVCSVTRPAGQSLNSSWSGTVNARGLQGKSLYVYATGDTGYVVARNYMTVTVTEADGTYPVTVAVSPSGGGTASASTAAATAGTTVTLTAAAAAGYQFSGWTSSPAVAITNNRFMMPSSAVTVTAVFTKITYTVSLAASPSGSGSVTANRSTAQLGDQVTLTATPAAGYQFSGWTSSPAVTISANRFTMPASHITITASFVLADYTVTGTAAPAGAGSVTPDPATAQLGDTVTLTQTPAAGWAFSSWSSEPAVTISSDSFTMPAGNVTVTANYLKLSTGSLSKNTFSGGEIIDLTITAADPSYSHGYIIDFGTGMTTGEVAVAAGTTGVRISVPTGWCDAIPTAESKTGGTLTLKTYSGQTLIGSTTVTGLTYLVPAAALPRLLTLVTTVLRTVDGVTYADIGGYVQNHSGVRMSAEGAGTYGAGIDSMTVEVVGYEGSRYTATAADDEVALDTGLLTISGQQELRISAVDTRGRSRSWSVTITVQAYNAPIINAFSIWRTDAQGTADDLGEYAQYSFSKVWSEIGTNTVTVTLAKTGGSSATNPPESGWIMPGAQEQLNPRTEHLFTLTVTDRLESVSRTVKLPTARYIMHVDHVASSGGDRIAFGKAAVKTIPAGKDGTLEISGDLQIYIGDETLEDYIIRIVGL